MTSKTKYCNCDDWMECIPKIDGSITISWLHGFGYDGKPFNFCPWCGEKLIEIKEKDVE